MNGKTVALVVVVIVVIVGGWYLLKGNPMPAATGTGEPAGNTTNTAHGVTVTYTAQGFSPASVTVPSGTAVTFVNQTSNPLWVASDPDPTDEWYDGTTKSEHCAPGYTGDAPFDQCSTGSSFTFTFTKTGSWGYHNDSTPADRGTVIVQ